MKHTYTLLFGLLLWQAAALGATPAERNGNVLFAQNAGQWADNSLFKADMVSGVLSAHANGLHFLQWDGHTLHEARHGHQSNIPLHYHRIIFSGQSNPHPVIETGNKSPVYRNYFLGNNAARWRGRVPLFHSITYKNVWKGIDISYYGNAGHLAYLLTVQPGAEADEVVLAYEGVENLRVQNGILTYNTSLAAVTESAPYAYQLINGKEVAVRCYFTIQGNRVMFALPDGYNEAHTLFIDPTLVFASYTGSTADNFGFTATYDNAGSLYAGGIVYGFGYPVTVGAFQQNFGNGIVDVSISKFSADGSSLLYSTYLGGNDNEQPNSLVVNSNNQLVILGTTSSPDFPVTANAYDVTFNGGFPATYANNGVAYTNGSDITLTVLNASGSALIGSTFFGGSSNDGLNDAPFLHYNYGDVFRGEVIVNSQNEILVASTTRSADFPVTAGAYKTNLSGSSDAVVYKFSPDCTQLLWSTYLGGSNDDAAYSIKSDSLSNIFVTGGTSSTDFPASTNAINPTYRGGSCDGFVARFNASGTALVNATFIGTAAYDQSFFVEIDGDNDVYITGQTLGSYPVTAGVYSNPNGKQFIHKMNNTFTSTLYSTVFGKGQATTDISPTAFLVDVCENVYVSGWGGSVNQFSPQPATQGNTIGMATTPDAVQSTTDGSDFYYIVLNKNATNLQYATFFGGNLSPEHVDGGTSRFDLNGIIYQAVCAGCGSNDDFPTTPGVVSNFNNSNNCNVGALKLSFDLAGTAVDIDASPRATGCVPLTVQFTGTLSNVSQFFWDFGDGNTSNQQNPTHLYTDTGTYTVTLIGIDSTSCNVADTAYLNVWVRDDSISANFLPDLYIDCDSNKVSLLSANYSTTAYLWNMGDGSTYTTDQVTHYYQQPGKYHITLQVSDTTKCNLNDTFSTEITIPATINAQFSLSDSNGCAPLTIAFTAQPLPTVSYIWNFGNGTTANTASAQTTYTTAGLYQIQLVVTDSASCNIADTALAQVEVIDSSADAGFSFTRTFFGCDSVQVTVWSTYSGEESETWDWGDGTQSFTDTAWHMYNVAGTYTITHTIFDAEQICKPLDTAQIVISLQPLSISITVPDTGGCLPFTASFTGNSVLQSTNFVWFFGDGSSATGDTVTYTYNSTGLFNVVVVATDTNACVGADSAFAQITVINDSVTADFNPVILNSCDSLLIVDLQNTSINATNYLWAFGDGNSSVQVNENYTYTVPGTYFITLYATDTNRCHPVDSVTKPVRLKPNTVIDFITADVCAGTPVQFTNLSNPAAAFLWSFGDGNVSAAYSPGHLYNTTGNFTVRLIMSDTSTCNVLDTLEKEVNVFAQPFADFITAGDTFKFGNPVAFLNKSIQYTNLFWDFGDGNSSTEENPEYTFAGIGTQTVCLTAINGNCFDTVCKNIFISFKKLIGVPNAFSPNGDGINDVVKVEGKGIVELLFRIYNRWGEKVFESNNQAVGWDGIYKGELQEMEAYAYWVDAKLINGETVQLKGNITLLR